MPVNAINMSLDITQRDMVNDKELDRHGHEVMAHANDNDAACSIVHDENRNIHAKGNENTGHVQTEVQQQVTIVEHCRRKLQNAGEVAFAGPIESANLTPKIDG